MNRKRHEKNRLCVFIRRVVLLTAGVVLCRHRVRALTIRCLKFLLCPVRADAALRCVLSTRGVIFRCVS